jgi:RND superfamily putative drug exporter
VAKVAGWCFDHRRVVLVAWIIAVGALIGTAVNFGSHFSDNYASGSLPSQQAQDLLNARFPAQAGATVDIVMHSPSALTAGQNAQTIDRLVTAIRPLAHVSSVSSPLSNGGQRQLSADAKTGFIVVEFDRVSADLPGSATRAVINTAHGFQGSGLQIAVGGTPAENVVTVAPGSSEGIGITAAVLIMVVAFGSVVAMGLPILIALIGVGMGFGIVFAASHALTIPTFGPDLMAMIGLGVGIDYALLIVTRYRQELSRPASAGSASAGPASAVRASEGGHEPERRRESLCRQRAVRCCSPAARWSSRCSACW